MPPDGFYIRRQTHLGEIRVFKKIWGRALTATLVVVGSGVLLAACGGGGSTASQQELAQAERHARQEKTEKEKERRLERKLARIERGNRLAKKHRRERVHRELKEREDAPVTPAPAPSVPESGTPSGTDCGGGVIAGPETSCGFALETRAEYEREIGAGPGSVEAYSEANHQWYPMYCTGAPHECSGAISATVYFP